MQTPARTLDGRCRIPVASNGSDSSSTRFQGVQATGEHTDPRAMISPTMISSMISPRCRAKEIRSFKTDDEQSRMSVLEHKQMAYPWMVSGGHAEGSVEVLQASYSIIVQYTLV